MTPRDEQYQDMIDPINFIKNFVDKEGFKAWLRSGTINDLKDMRNVFEKREMYLECGTIQSVIDEKVDIMLSGFGIKID
mgnify:CR=1 FL=1